MNLKALQKLAEDIGGVAFVEDGKIRSILLSYKKYEELRDAPLSGYNRVVSVAANYASQKNEPQEQKSSSVHEVNTVLDQDNRGEEIFSDKEEDAGMAAQSREGGSQEIEELNKQITELRERVAKKEEALSTLEG